MNYVNYEKVKILKMTFSSLPIKLFFYKKIKENKRLGLWMISKSF